MHKSTETNTRTLLRIGLIANVLESYEFAIYTFLAPIIGQLFLEPTDQQSLYIKSYLLVCCGFLARPIGGFLWGYCADHVGRSFTLKLSLVLMSVTTVLMGILPTYSQIGVLATASFLLLRFMQGFSKGGEYSISGCYVYEASKLDQRSLLCGIVGASTVIGMLSASCVTSLLFWYFDRHTVLAWAWRIPYLLGIPITFWIVRLRKSIRDLKHATSSTITPSPQQPTQRQTLSFILQLIPLILIVGFMEFCSYTLFIWLPSYLNYFLKIDLTLAQFCNTVGMSLWVGFIILSGYLSSRFGYKRLITVHTVAMIITIVPLFKLVQLGTYSALLTAYVIFAWVQSGIPAVTMEMLGDAFPREIRGLGMSLGQNLAATLFGSTAPLVSSVAIHHTGISIFPAFYIIALGLLTLLMIPLISYRSTEKR